MPSVFRTHDTRIQGIYMNLKSNCDAAIRSKLTLALLLMGALFTMGAKWAEQPIRDFQSVAGEWRGSGQSAGSSIGFLLTFIIKEDRTYRAIARWRYGNNDNTGPLRLNEGKIQFKSPTNGQTVTVTLFEGKKGKRQLKARRPDGLTWKVKPAKK